MMALRETQAMLSPEPSDESATMPKENDIKAPDGFLLGGMRRVRSDGTILFQRGWWEAPREWVGEDVWVHTVEGGLEGAPPGFHIYHCTNGAVPLTRTNRPDARPGYRKPAHKAWAERMARSMLSPEPKNIEPGGE